MGGKTDEVKGRIKEARADRQRQASRGRTNRPGSRQSKQAAQEAVDTVTKAVKKAIG